MNDMAKSNNICLTIATIEAFLAIYGDLPRYKGDNAASRRQDVRLAVGRLRILTDDSGGVQITATRTDPCDEMNLLGFLETYERNTEPFTIANCRNALNRLKLALPSIIVAQEGRFAG